MFYTIKKKKFKMRQKGFTFIENLAYENFAFLNFKNEMPASHLCYFYFKFMASWMSEWQGSVSMPTA